jgi:heme O synthase-like polyprenyltransferase
MTVRTQAFTLAPTPPWRSYLKLCKIKVVSLVVFTALVAMVLASPPGNLPWATVLAATIGIAHRALPRRCWAGVRLPGRSAGRLLPCS